MLQYVTISVKIIFREESDCACDLIDGCTLCNPEKIVYIDELDPEDSCNKRLEITYPYRKGGMVKPEAEWAGDGTILTQFFVPLTEDFAAAYGIEMATKMGLAGSPSGQYPGDAAG